MPTVRSADPVPERSSPPGVNMYVPSRSCLRDRRSPSKAHQCKASGLARTRLKLAIPVDFS